MVLLLFWGLTACGGGSPDDSTIGPSTSDSTDVTDATDASDTGLSGGIENFRNYTAGPATFVKIEQSDENSSAFPTLSSIPTHDADRIAINDTALVAADKGSGELKVIDLNSFTEIGRLNNVSTVLALNFSSDATLYIDTVGQGLRKISLSDPGESFQLRRILTFYTAYESFVRDNTLFQTMGVNGLLEVWDIENSDRPSLVSRVSFKDEDISENELLFPFQGRAFASIDNNTLLIAARAGGGFVLDITHPEAPFIRDRYFPENTQIWDVAVAGSNAYLAAGNQIHVLDISNPNNIVPIIGIDVPGFVQKVKINDGHAAFALAEAGVLLHRLADDPKMNYTLIPMPQGAVAQDAVYQSDAVYVAAGTQVLKLSR